MIFRILLFLERLLYGSERLFKFMILNEIEENSLFIEIGSSDLSETKLVLKNKKKVNVLIFEPDSRNINNYDQKIIKDKRLRIIKKIISSKTGKQNFYLHKKFSNLNQLSRPRKDKLKNFYEKKIITANLEKEVKKYKKYSKLIIKMDIEGYEFEVIKKNINLLRKKKNISLLVELHPMYYKKNSMKNLMSKLVSYGYEFKMIESAKYIRPNSFKKKSYFPFRKSLQRGLYKNVNVDFVLNNAFTYKNKKTKNIRSILLTKR